MNQIPFVVRAAVAAGLLAVPGVARGQDPWAFRSPGLSRQQLEQVQARLDAAARSPAYSAALQARARADADSVRQRLRDGDFRVGDRILLSVEGQATLAANTLVVSTAVREDNPEVVEARERGLRLLPRSAALDSVMQGRTVVAVAGTHGKTTTTSLLTVAL